MTDPDREDAEDAALDYSDNPVEQEHFIKGWLWFCNGMRKPPPYWKFEKFKAWFLDGYIAARDAPDY